MTATAEATAAATAAPTRTVISNLSVSDIVVYTGPEGTMQPGHNPKR